MRPLWLIPTSAAAGAAVTLAVLVASGQATLRDSRKAAPAGQIMVLHPEAALAPARRVAELEQKISALKQENGHLAGQLALKKGVTIDQVHERIATLSRAPMAGLLAPAALADLVTDLKGLGPAGVQAMIRLLKSADPKKRFLAANLLENLNSPLAVDALEEAALTDGDEMATNMASHALAFMDDAAAVPALRAIADQTGSWGAQVNALWGLCKHGDQKGIVETLAFVKDAKRSAQARATLGSSLMVLSDPELMPIIDQTVKDFGSNAEVAKMAINYYKTVGTVEGRDRLEAMAKDPSLDEPTRQAARQALSGKGP